MGITNQVEIAMPNAVSCIYARADMQTVLRTPPMQ